MTLIAGTETFQKLELCLSSTIQISSVVEFVTHPSCRRVTNNGRGLAKAKMP
jgi:hypothetical protein